MTTAPTEATFQAHAALDAAITFGPSYSYDGGFGSVAPEALFPQFDPSTAAEAPVLSGPWIANQQATSDVENDRMPVSAPSSSHSANSKVTGMSLLRVPPGSLDGIRQEILTTLSVVPPSNPQFAGTECFGPVHIQKVPNRAESKGQSRRYRFQFVVEGRSGPVSFQYAASQDLHEAIAEFLEDENLDLDLLLPMLSTVQAVTGETVGGGWRLGIGSSSRFDTVPAADISAADAHSSPIDGPPAEAREQWIDSQHFQPRDSIGVQYAPADQELQLTCTRTLSEVRDDSAAPDGGSKQHCASEGPDALKMWFRTSFACRADSFFAREAQHMVSATLAAVAQLLHNSGASQCHCNFGITQAVGAAFIFELLRDVTLSLPSSSDRQLLLCHQQAKLAFGQLEYALRRLGQPLEGLVSLLQKDRRCRSAVKCIVSALDGESHSHADVVGPWAWEGLILPIFAPRVSSGTSAFTGRLGYPNTADSPDETGQVRLRNSSIGDDCPGATGPDTDLDVIIVDDDDDGDDAATAADALAQFRQSSRSKPTNRPHYNMQQHPQDASIPGPIKKRKAAVGPAASPKKKRQQIPKIVGDTSDRVRAAAEGTVAAEENNRT